MDLDGTIVHLQAGDSRARGTIHNWIDRGDEPCVTLALVSAKPVTAGGKTLQAQG